MACGLPIITTDKCVAGRELVENDKNGFILPVGDDVGLVRNVQNVIYDSDKLEEMSKNSLQRIKNCTIEDMAKVHIEIFQNQLLINE